MKTLKTAVIATIITCLLILGCAYATAETDPNLSDFYPTTAIVVGVDYELDKVSCVTFKGETYEFYGCYDWDVGDVCALYMWDCGTALDKTDDEIIDVEYSGRFTLPMVAEWLEQ